jgi:pyridoxamine 5'-phosphate oxidase family protein
VRALIILVEVAIVVVLVIGVYGAVTALGRGRKAALPAGGRWQARHYAEDGHTVVAVARLTRTNEVVEEHVVARIPDQDDDWSRKFLAARQEAEERAFHLNADGP